MPDSPKASIPFAYKFEQHATSAVHTSYVLRLDYLPKSEEEITATCVLTRKGHFAGIFPLRLQQDKKEKCVSFSVDCLASDLVEEARIVLDVRDPEKGEKQSFSLALKDAKKR